MVTSNYTISENSRVPKTMISQFHPENGSLDIRGLAHAIRTEVDVDGWILIPYMQIFLNDCKLQTALILRLLGALHVDEHNIFIQFLIYQRIFPDTTPEEFKAITLGLEYPMRTADRITNNNLYHLENMLGLHKGSLCDMNRP